MSACTGSRVWRERARRRHRHRGGRSTLDASLLLHGRDPKSLVARSPVAAKRGLRALLKAVDVCATNPERAAGYLVAKGYEPRGEMGIELVKRLPYDRGREANPEDALRFYALRLHDVGMIRSPPQKIMAQGSDRRFLNELKKELKA